MRLPSGVYKQSVSIWSEIAQGQRVQGDIICRVQACNFSEHDVFAIRLAVEEALVNAIKHGNGSDPKKKVQIDYQVSREEFRIRIQDEGAGFDLDSVPDPTSPGYLEQPSGRGLMLMRHYMTEVTFNQRGNCVEMSIRKGDSNSEGADDD